jgi:hypothetical protein
MICDIFIKTYHGDFCWLDGCLKSIKKYCSGFRDVVIVTEDDGHIIPPELSAILPFKVHYVPLPSRIPTKINALGIGYIWQQNIKLNWINYTDADMVIIVDSDEMFRKAVTPEHFMTNGKLNWWARKWEEAPGCECHKPNTDIILKTNTLYETMACPVFAFDRQTTIEFLKYICELHGVSSFWDIVIKYNLNHISEYNVFGNYINLTSCPKYNFRFDLVNAFNHHAICIFWSWGGMSPEKIMEREKILSCE